MKMNVMLFDNFKMDLFIGQENTEQLAVNKRIKSLRSTKDAIEYLHYSNDQIEILY